MLVQTEGMIIDRARGLVGCQRLGDFSQSPSEDFGFGNASKLRSVGQSASPTKRAGLFRSCANPESNVNFNLRMLWIRGPRVIDLVVREKGSAAS